MPSTQNAPYIALALLVLICCANALSVHWGGQPFAYCWGRTLVRATGLIEVYKVLWVAALGIGAFQLATKGWQRSIKWLLICALVIQAPEWLDQGLRLGGSCGAAPAPVAVAPEVVVPQPVPLPAPPPPPVVAPAPPAPPPLDIRPPAQRVAKSAAVQIDADRWYPEQQVMKLLGADERRMQRIRQANPGKYTSPPLGEPGRQRTYQGSVVLAELQRNAAPPNAPSRTLPESR